MPKYVVMRPVGWVDWDEPPRTMDVVVASPEGPQPTGLVDASGTPIYRVRDPIGFRSR